MTQWVIQVRSFNIVIHFVKHIIQVVLSIHVHMIYQLNRLYLSGYLCSIWVVFGFKYLMHLINCVMFWLCPVRWYTQPISTNCHPQIVPNISPLPLSPKSLISANNLNSNLHLPNSALFHFVQILSQKVMQSTGLRWSVNVNEREQKGKQG